MKKQQPESREKIALMQWARLNKNIEPYLFLIENGGFRTPLEAVFLKREGLKPGVSDYFFAYPSNGYHGLWIEMKADESCKATPSQKSWIETMISVGYSAYVAHGWIEAKNIIEEYIKVK